MKKLTKTNRNIKTKKIDNSENHQNSWTYKQIIHNHRQLKYQIKKTIQNKNIWKKECEKHNIKNSLITNQTT